MNAGPHASKRAVHEVRDAVEARRFLEQSLWLERFQTPEPPDVGLALDWARALASAGIPLPPLGFLADLGKLALGGEPLQREHREVPGWPAGLLRAYEDSVLSKLVEDKSLQRGADALRRYQGRDRDRALIYLLEQVCRRLELGGVLLNPAIMKSLPDPMALLREGWQELLEEGLLPYLPLLVQDLITAMRVSPSLLGAEDIFELEQGTALAPFGERLALRQIVQAAALFEARVPARPPRSLSRRHDVATQILVEDVFPAGGFASLSNRGSMESLLHSQLAYMDPDNRPDLFDVKYLRDELLFYARDENQFLRRRRAFVFVFHSDLVSARVKDLQTPTQRSLLLLALTWTMVRTLSQWLCNEGMVFDLVFLGDPAALAPERDLAQRLFRAQIVHHAVIVDPLNETELADHCARLRRRSRTDVLLFSCGPDKLQAEDMSRLQIGRPVPVLLVDDVNQLAEVDDPMEAWSEAIDKILRLWI